MANIILKARVREKTGKEATKKLRRQGLLPGILYGPTTTPLPVSLNPSSVLRALREEQTGSSFFGLEIEGDHPKRVKVVIKDVAIHPVTDELVHVDLYQVAMDKELSVEVPIIITGKAKGVERGGIVEQNLREIPVTALPDKIPEHIEVDITELDLGDSIHVADLKVPEGVKVEEDPQVAVVTIVAPEEEAASTEEEEEEGA